MKKKTKIWVSFDDDLTFEPHILEQVKEANEMSSLIRQNFEVLDAERLPLSNKTAVETHLEYAAPVWVPAKLN